MAKSPNFAGRPPVGFVGFLHQWILNADFTIDRWFSCFLSTTRTRVRSCGPTIQCFCWPVIGFPPSFSLILFPLNFYILPPSKSCILATWKCEAALTLRRAEAADRHAPTSRISAPTLVRQTPIHAPARWSSPPVIFYLSKVYSITLFAIFLSSQSFAPTFILGFLFIFFSDFFVSKF